MQIQFFRPFFKEKVLRQGLEILVYGAMNNAYILELEVPASNHDSCATVIYQIYFDTLL